MTQHQSDSPKSVQPSLSPESKTSEPEPFASSDDLSPSQEVAQHPVREPHVVAGGSTMEPTAQTHSRERNVGGRVMSSAHGVGDTGQGAILASGMARVRAYVPEAGHTHHESVEEAIARMNRTPYPLVGQILARQQLQAGGYNNPSPAEFWWDQGGARATWAARAAGNMNQQ